MKLHYNLVNAVANGLKDIFENSAYADKVIEKLLKSDSRWGARDRAFVAENTYECVRWWRLLWFLNNRNTPDFEKESLFRIIGINIVLKTSDFLPDWKEFKGINRSEIISKLEDAKKSRVIIESIPDWMDALCSFELNTKWDDELHALNDTASVVLRTNTLKISPKELRVKLSEQSIHTQPVKLSNTALQLEKRVNIFNTEMFKKAYFEVQDAGSQTIAPFLETQPGMRVIDACAGAGGKSLHLACLMENKGKIISLDTEAWKLKELHKRAVRNGIDIIETRVIEDSKSIKRLENSADRLLLDVPCSGLGVLKRNPDAKWKLSKEFILQIQQTQTKIFSEYALMLKKGGLMVYATCSILPSENENQVKKFLEEKNGAFEFIKEKHISPSKDGFDGFYMALIKRIK